MIEQPGIYRIKGKLFRRVTERNSVNHIPQFIMMKQSYHNTNRKTVSKDHLSTCTRTQRMTVSHQKRVHTTNSNSHSKLQTVKKANERIENSDISQNQVIPKLTNFRKSFNKIKTLSDQIITPTTNKMCQNHPFKNADYTFQVPEQFQDIYYCKKCAAQLASQGFQVLSFQEAKQSKYDSSKQLLNSLGQFTFSQENKTIGLGLQNKKKKLTKQLKSLLMQITDLRQNHLQTIQKSHKIQSIYKTQIEIVDNFYLSLINAFENYRDQHIKGLQTECRLLINDFDREQLFLKKSIKQLDDISSEVKQKISESSKEDNQNKVINFLNYYKQIVATLQSRQQKIDDCLINFPEYKPQQLEKTIKSIEGSLHLMLNGIKSRSVYTCIKPINIKIKDLHNRRTIGRNQCRNHMGIIPLSFVHKGLQETRKNQKMFFNQGTRFQDSKKFNTQTNKINENSARIVQRAAQQPFSAHKLKKCQSNASLALSYELFDEMIEQNVQGESPQFRNI